LEKVSDENKKNEVLN